jgi:hypothetical protein
MSEPLLTALHCHPSDVTATESLTHNQSQGHAKLGASAGRPSDWAKARRVIARSVKRRGGACRVPYRPYGAYQGEGGVFTGQRGQCILPALDLPLSASRILSTPKHALAGPHLARTAASVEVVRPCAACSSLSVWKTPVPCKQRLPGPFLPWHVACTLRKIDFYKHAAGTGVVARGVISHVCLALSRA